MLFNSWEYLILLSVTVALYWALPWRTARQLMLLVASLVFYASWQPIYIILMLAVILLVFFLTLAGKREGFGFAALAAILVPLGVLAIFKYTNFAISTAGDISEIFGGERWSTLFNLILPLGISFYTFQVISYIVDVKRNEFPVERNPLVFTLFVTFFPHLIAGPICRAHQLIPQLRDRPAFQWSDFTHGLLLLASGLFLKAAIADNLSPFVNSVFDAPADSAGWRCILAIFGFGVVILCDFWGYSTMAIGSAYLMGIKLPLNFNLPYAATSLQDFWRRWHMTLSNWLRDYVYIPLGGSRGGALLTYRNLFLTFLLGGLWHGAAYSFIIWGAIHGGWLTVERIFHGLTGQLAKIRWLMPVRVLSGWIITMSVVCTAWVFFRAKTPGDAIALLFSATRLAPVTVKEFAVHLFFLGLFLTTLVPLHNFQFNTRWMAVRGTLKLALSFWLLVGTTLLASGVVEPFIYFQF